MSIPPEAWARLLSAGGIRRYEPGTVLLRQGDPATHVLALVSGRVKVMRTLPDGSIVVLSIRGPGEILGEISVLGGDSRAVTVAALDHCEARSIPAERFLLLVRSLGLEIPLLRQAMNRIRDGETWRSELAVLPAGPRLVRTLLRLAGPSLSGPAEADIGLDQTELGQAAGLSRSTVAAELARLRDQGIITTARRRVVITDLDRLRELARADHAQR